MKGYAYDEEDFLSCIRIEDYSSMVEYLYKNEVNDEGDNKPIGIILCTDKDAIAAEYALGGLSTNIFASKYTYYIPEKEQLIAEVERIVSQWHEQE